MKRSHRKLLFIAAIIIVLVIALSVGINGAMKKLESFNQMDFSVLDMEAVEDGTYTGSADASIVKATVEVTVKDHTMTDIQILEHNHGQGKPAETIVKDIMERNSLEVDAVSGATHSSNVIKAAILDALTK